MRDETARRYDSLQPITIVLFWGGATRWSVEVQKEEYKFQIIYARVRTRYVVDSVTHTPSLPALQMADRILLIKKLEDALEIELGERPAHISLSVLGES